MSVKEELERRRKQRENERLFELGKTAMAGLLAGDTDENPVYWRDGRPDAKRLAEDAFDIAERMLVAYERLISID